MVSYFNVKKELEQGSVQPVYFFYGVETYLIEDLIRSIVQQTVGNEYENQVTTYSLQDTLLDDIIEDAATISFFGGRKVIIVKDFYIPTTAKADDKLEHNVNKLEAYVQNPSLETYLIFVAEVEKLDARKKITKTLQKHVKIVECSPFDGRMMNEWVDYQARENGYSFSQEAKDELIARAGTQLLILASEIEKIGLYVGEGGEATAKVVSDLTARSLEQDVFALIDFVLRRKVDQALMIYHDLLKQREEPLKILALIARQLRIYYQVKELLRRSYSQKQIAGQIKLHPYVVKLAAEQVKHFEEAHLLSLLKNVADTDYSIKTGKMDKVLAVELLLMRIGA